MRSDNKSSVAAVGCVILMTLPFLAVWRGYALTILWRWFLQPTFGIQAPPLGTAVGLLFIVSLLSDLHVDHDRDDEVHVSGAIAALVRVWLTPGVCILFGYCARLWP